MENVKSVIKKANINTYIMGNKAFKDMKASNPSLHHMSAEGRKLLCTFEQRKNEAVKFAPFIKVGDVAEQEPAITKGDVVKWFEQEGLSLTINDFSKMLEGTRAAAEPRAKRGEPKPVAQAVSQATSGVTITIEQHQFYMLLLEATKRVAPEIINNVMEVMHQQKLKEAEERIKAELLASMGSLASLLDDVEPTITPTDVEYSAELRSKANRVLEDAETGKKVAPYLVEAAKCVLSNASITEEQEQRLEAIKL